MRQAEILLRLRPVNHRVFDGVFKIIFAVFVNQAAVKIIKQTKIVIYAVFAHIMIVLHYLPDLSMIASANITMYYYSYLTIPC